MSDDAKDAPKKKGGKKKLLVLVGGGLLLVGAGASAGIYAAGAGMADKEEAHVDPNEPQLVPKQGLDEEEAKAAKPAKGKGGEPSFDRTKFEATYFDLKDPFTSNLRDSDGFMQIALGLATYYDERVLKNIEANQMPIRSAVLMTLADQDAFVVSTPDGKKALQDALKAAINDALVARTGFGGVDNVYFTSFIIQ